MANKRLINGAWKWICPVCHTPDDNGGWCDACKALYRWTKQFSHAGSDEPIDGASERVEALARRAALNLPLFPARS